MDPTTSRHRITVLRIITDVALHTEGLFSADDVQRELAAQRIVVQPNALGAGFRLARKSGLIEEVYTARSTRPTARGRRVTYYRRVGAQRGAPLLFPQQQAIPFTREGGS